MAKKKYLPFVDLTHLEQIEALKQVREVIRLNDNEFICTGMREISLDINSIQLVHIAEKYSLTHLFSDDWYRSYKRYLKDEDDMVEDVPLWNIQQRKERLDFIDALIKAMQQENS